MTNPRHFQSRTVAWLAAASLLAGCSLFATSDRDAELKAAKSAMDDARRDYELCIHDMEEAAEEMDCDILDEIFQEDRDEYESLLQRRKATGL